MKQISLKISLMLAISLILLVMLSIKVEAANGDLEILQSGEDCIIYVEGYETTPFKFALSNDSSSAVEDLQFYKNWTDSNGNYVACLDNEMGINLESDIFIWIVDSNTNTAVVSAKKVDLSTKISTEEIENIENLTKEISVDANQTNTEVEKVGDTFFYTTTGKLVVTDDSSCTYKYDIVKIPDTTNVENFINNVKNYGSKSAEMTVVEKIRTVRTINADYENIMNAASWKNVESMTINQPEESREGDRYAVLIEKISDGEVIEKDLKIMTSYKKFDQVKTSSTVPTAVTSALPVTSDSMVLYIVFAAVVAVIIAIIVRIFFIKNNEKNENK